MTACWGILKNCGSKKKRNAFVLLSDEPAQFCPTDVSQCRATVPPAPRLYCLECYWSEICRFSSSTCKQSLWLTEGLFGFGSTSGWADDKSVESRCKMTKNISHANIPAPLWIIGLKTNPAELEIMHTHNHTDVHAQKHVHAEHPPTRSYHSLYNFLCQRNHRNNLCGCH